MYAFSCLPLEPLRVIRMPNAKWRACNIILDLANRLKIVNRKLQNIRHPCASNAGTMGIAGDAVPFFVVEHSVQIMLNTNLNESKSRRKCIVYIMSACERSIFMDGWVACRGRRPFKFVMATNFIRIFFYCIYLGLASRRLNNSIFTPRTCARHVVRQHGHPHRLSIWCIYKLDQLNVSTRSCMILATFGCRLTYRRAHNGE